MEIVQNNVKYSSAIYDTSLSVIQELRSFELSLWKEESHELTPISSSVIFFVDSCQDYTRAHEPELMNTSPKNLKFIFTIEDCSLNFIIDDISNILSLKKSPSYSWKNQNV